MRTIGACLLIVIWAMTCVAAAPAEMRAHASEELPTPPAGFSWKNLPDVGADFLMPDGWHHKAKQAKGTFGHFITAEDIDAKGGFDTGLSINVTPKMKGKDAVAYARAFIEGMGKKHELIKSWEGDVGGLSGFSCELRLPADASSSTTRIRYLAVGNKATNTLYLMFFEAPEEQWDSAWKKGEFLLTVFALDPEF